MADGSQLTDSSYRKQRTLWRFLRIFLASWVVIGGSIAAIVGMQTNASGTSKTTAVYTTTDVHGATVGRLVGLDEDSERVTRCYRQEP